MNSNKQNALKDIKKRFEKISNKVLKQIINLSQIIIEFDLHSYDELVKKIRKNEKQIDKYDLKLDEHIINAIVLYKPVANELRQLFSIYRMVINLERVGDLIIKITYIIIELKNIKIYKTYAPKINDMLQLSLQMLNSALLSFTNNNKEGATWTINNETKLNKLFHELTRNKCHDTKITAEMQTIIDTISDIRTIASSIERIGDQATNIAEASIYSQSGKNIRHNKQAKPIE